MNDEPTYEELKRTREAEWREAQYTRAKKLTALQEELAKMPDVVNAPTIGSLYSHPAITCPCGGLAFTVRRYGCVNGVRDKADFTCQRCSTTMTWNWTELTWQN